MKAKKIDLPVPSSEKNTKLISDGAFRLSRFKRARVTDVFFGAIHTHAHAAAVGFEKGRSQLGEMPKQRKGESVVVEKRKARRCRSRLSAALFSSINQKGALDRFHKNAKLTPL